MKVIRDDKRGYTLVELMVVITIMAILAAASTPVFTGYIKKAKASEHLAECRAVYMAAEAYLLEASGGNSSTVDLDDLEEEIEQLTTLDVEISDDDEKEPDADYGVVVSDDGSDKWRCKAVTCMIDGELWRFHSETGEFEKIR